MVRWVLAQRIWTAGVAQFVGWVISPTMRRCGRAGRDGWWVNLR